MKKFQNVEGIALKVLKRDAIKTLNISNDGEEEEIDCRAEEKEWAAVQSLKPLQWLWLFDAQLHPRRSIRFHLSVCLSICVQLSAQSCTYFTTPYLLSTTAHWAATASSTHSLYSTYLAPYSLLFHSLHCTALHTLSDWWNKIRQSVEAKVLSIKMSG